MHDAAQHKLQPSSTPHRASLASPELPKGAWISLKREAKHFTTSLALETEVKEEEQGEQGHEAIIARQKPMHSINRFIFLSSRLIHRHDAMLRYLRDVMA